MISSDSCLLLSLLFPFFLPARFRFSKEASLPIFSPEKPSLHSVVYLCLINFLAPPLSCTIYLPIPLYGCRARRGHWTDFTRLCTQKGRNARFHAGFVTRTHKRFYHHELSRLQANKSLISTSDLNFDSSLLPFSPLLLPRKINHEEEEVEEEEASDQRRSKVEDVEEKETKRKERNAEEIARRKQGAETVTETETAATSGYPLSASSIVVITRKRKLRGSETVGKVVKVGWGGEG